MVPLKERWYVRSHLVLLKRDGLTTSASISVTVINFAQVLRAFLMRVAMYYLKYSEAEDLTHEILLKILRGKKKRMIIAAGSKAQTYFSVVVRNAVISKYRVRTVTGTRRKAFPLLLSEIIDHRYIKSLSHDPDVAAFIYTQKQLDYLRLAHPHELTQILTHIESRPNEKRPPWTPPDRVRIWRLRRKLRQSLGTANLA